VILESKSLKLYLWSYRDEGFSRTRGQHDLRRPREGADPHWIEVTGVFNARGGVGITVVAAHERKPRARHAASRCQRHPGEFTVRSYRFLPFVTSIFVTCLIVSNIIASR